MAGSQHGGGAGLTYGSVCSGIEAATVAEEQPMLTKHMRDQRVAIRGEGAEYEGTVVHPSGSTHYVHVVLDGRSDPGLFHPGSVVPLDPNSPANAGGRT